MGTGHTAAAFAPETRFAEVDGIPLVFGGLLATATGVFIHMYCAPNEATEALDADYRAAFEAWKAEAAAARDREERPPDAPWQPGTMLHKLPLILNDDLGTQYRKIRSQSAGSGTEWEVNWRFTPAVPKNAQYLTVALDTDDCRNEGMTLLL